MRWLAAGVWREDVRGCAVDSVVVIDSNTLAELLFDVLGRWRPGAGLRPKASSERW